MAKQGQQIDELFISLGLDIAQLQLDFDTAGKTVSSAISKLNSSSNKIKLQMETDLSKLDGVGSELDKIKVKYEAINHQLELQRQKESILAAVLKDAQKNSGKDSGIANKAEQDLLRQQKAVAQLEAEYRKLETEIQKTGEAQNNLLNTQTNSLLNGYQNLKGEVAGSLNSVVAAFQSIKTASGSADGAITKSLEIIDKIPHPAGKAAAALAAIPLVMHGVENSLVNLAKPAISAGDSFYVMSRGMQMSIKDAAQLSMICKVTGIDINEVNSAMRRFSTQVSKADGDNSMLKMLKQYGAEVKDSSGRIKNELELAGELGRALKKAQAEGNGAAFRDIVGGRFWSGDFVTFLEDFADNVEQAKKVVKNGLADPARAHAIQGELNTLEAQAGQLNSAFSSAFMPLAEVLIPRTTERLGELTKIIAENADGIKTLGGEMANVLDSIENVAAKGGEFLIEKVGDLGNTIQILNDSGLENYLSRGKNLGAFLGALWGSLGGPIGTAAGSAAGFASGETIFALVAENFLKLTGDWGEYQRKALLEQEKRAFQDLEKIKGTFNGGGNVEAITAEQKQIAEIQNNLEEQMKLATSQRLKDKLEEIQETTQESIRLGQSEAAAWKSAEKEISKAIKEARAEAEKANEELKQSIYELTHNDYQIKLDKVDTRTDEMLNRGADRSLVMQEAELLRQQITEEFNRDVLDKMDETYQTELEKRLHAIDTEKQAWIKKGADEVAAVEWAENEKSKIIEEFTTEVTSKVNSLFASELDNRLAQIEQEKKAWIKKGLDEVQATKLAEAEKAKAIQDFNNEVAAKMQSVYGTELSTRMFQIEQEKQAWIKKGMSEAQATQMAEAEKAKAMQDFENYVAANVDSIWQTSLQNKLDMIEREKQAWIQKGVDEVKATQTAEQAKADARKNAAMSVLKSQLEEYHAFQEGGFQGLRDYQLEQLHKAGITDEDLKMTPYQLSAFQNAKKLAESSLLPNLMSVDDRKDYMEMLKPDYSGITIDGKTFTDNPALTDLSNNLANLNSSFADNAALSELSNKLSDLSVALTDYSRQQLVTYASDGVNQNISQQSLPPQANVTVQIEEAHAWDSEHIQELAEKVADKITPSVVNALGGNDNSY